MSQQRLDLGPEGLPEPLVQLEPEVRRALVELMGTAIVEVWKAGGRGDDPISAES